MFAYSSISQAGYVLVGVQAASSQGTAGSLYYLFTYTFIIIGTFAVIEIIQGPGEARNDLGAMRGLSRRQPLLAGAWSSSCWLRRACRLPPAFSASSTSSPAVIQRGQYALGIIAMLAAAVAAFFYLRVALLMYSPVETESAAPEAAGALEGAGVTGTAAVPAAGGVRGRGGAGGGWCGGLGSAGGGPVSRAPLPVLR